MKGIIYLVVAVLILIAMITAWTIDADPHVLTFLAGAASMNILRSLVDLFVTD